MPRTHAERYTDPARATRTRQETARLVGCSPAQVDVLVAKGHLTGVPIGNRTNVTVTSVERLLGKNIEALEAPLRPAPAAPPARTKRKEKARAESVA